MAIFNSYVKLPEGKIQLKSPMSSHEMPMILLIHTGEDAASGAPVAPHVQRVFLPPLGPKAMEDAEVKEIGEFTGIFCIKNGM